MNPIFKSTLKDFMQKLTTKTLYANHNLLIGNAIRHFIVMFKNI